MALVSSLFTAISGLRNHQTMLDTISNNVSNVNTIGFKAGRVMFRDMLSQTLSSGSGSDSANNRGGTNPIQTGTGVALASIDTIQTQGAMQATGIATDCSIQGDGFFVTKNGNSLSYTRAGMFRFDSAGNLVDPNGSQVQGWMAAQPVSNPLAKNVIDASDPTKIGNITVNSGSTQKPQETLNMALTGNLDAGANAANLTNSTGVAGTVSITSTDGAVIPNTFTYNVGQTKIASTVYDSLGNAHQLTTTLTNLSGTQIPSAPTGSVYDNNTWSFTVDTDPNDATVHLAMDNTTYTDPITNQPVRAASTGVLHFNTNGSLDYVTYQDRNAEHFGTSAAGVANDPTIPGGWNAVPVVNSWQDFVDNDSLNGMMIGFEGATVPNGDIVGLATANQFDNPGNAALNWTDTLGKLPIVLVYQNVPAGSPVPPANTTAGRLATIDVAGVDARTGGTPAALQDWYVQAVNVDWGTVSVITGADFDQWSAGGGDDAINDIPFIGDNPDGVDIAPNPTITGRSAWGGRDGLTQDATGTWQVINGVQTYVPSFTAYLKSQDGYAEGVLQSVSIDTNGIINGAFSNGQFQQLAQMATARFENPAGLAKSGATNFVPTSNSGNAVIGTANSNGRGGVVGGALEQSNVDLSKELTDMIVAQRGFEVNARLVTTSDRILDTLVNLGR